MKKPYILSLIVLAGFVLNFAFTVTPTKTEAVFGGENNSDPLILSQESGVSFMSDTLSPVPADESEDEAVAPVITVASDSVVAEGLLLLPTKAK